MLALPRIFNVRQVLKSNRHCQLVHSLRLKQVYPHLCQSFPLLKTAMAVFYGGLSPWPTVCRHIAACFTRLFP